MFPDLKPPSDNLQKEKEERDKTSPKPAKKTHEHIISEISWRKYGEIN